MKKISSKLLTLALIAVLAFSMNGCALTKMIAPESYVKSAIKKSGEQMKHEAPKAPDTTRFADVPLEWALAVNVADSSDDTGMMNGASADLNMKIDAEAKKMLAAVSAGVPGITLRDNEVFVSQDLLALSIPLLYSGNRYLTAVPATFTQDWNNSALGEYMPIPEDYDMPAAIDTMFEAQTTTTDMDFAAEAERVVSLTKGLLDGAVFSKGTPVELNLDANTVKADVFTYTVSADTLNTYFKDVCQILYSVFDRYAALAGESVDMDQYEETKAFLDGVVFQNEANLTFYIDNKERVRKVEFFGLDVTSGDSGAVTLAADIAYDGATNPYSSYVANASFTADEGLVQVAVDHQCASTKTKVEENWDVDVNVDDQPQKFSYAVSWDTAVTDADNLNMSFVMDGISDVTLTGLLTDSAEAVSLENGMLKANMLTSEDYVNVSLNTSIKAVDAAEVAVDTTDSRSLFELTSEELMSMMMSMYSLQ